MSKLEFLKRVEGNEYHAYIPASGKSGVTIGIGVDLGNIGVKSLDVGQELLEKILPYDGLKGVDAAVALDSTPLRLSREEVDLLSLAAIELHEDELVQQYGPDYINLHPNLKIVLLSVKYQYGSLASRTPKFWRFAREKNWEAVYNELMNFGDDYPTRRRKEAQLVADYIAQTQEERQCSKTYSNKPKKSEIGLQSLAKLCGRLGGLRSRNKP